VWFAGLAPVLAVGERSGLSELIAERVRFKTARVRAAGVNPVGKLTSIIAGMAAGADSIDDLDAIRSGGMRQLFTGVYACATLGQFLREFTHGHTLQLASAARAHLVNLVEHGNVLPGIEQRAFIDIDSLLRPVFGHQKQGASFGFTKIAGKPVLRKGLSPLVTTIGTEQGAPVIAGIRLRAGRTGSAKGAASMVAEAIRTARTAGAGGEILVRGDSAYGSSVVINACITAGARFSFVLITTAAVAAAIAAITEDAWTPVHYPGAVLDPDTGHLISDAEVAEIEFTAFTGRRKAQHVTARLIVRRVRRLAPPRQGELLPAWRHHAIFTDSPLLMLAAETDHRDHAIIEQLIADLIDGPLAHLPSGHFAANAAWLTCAGIAHNLLRASATLPSRRHRKARGATVRRELINIPARLAHRGRDHLILHLPQDWPWQDAYDGVFDATHRGPPARAA